MRETKTDVERDCELVLVKEVERLKLLPLAQQSSKTCFTRERKMDSQNKTVKECFCKALIEGSTNGSLGFSATLM